MNIRLTKEQKIKILNQDNVYSIMQQILLRENKIRRGQEHFWVIGLNNGHKILFIELMALGADNRVSIKPADVFRMCVYKLATKVIFVHNHPSGNLKPSEVDLDLTNLYIKTGNILGLDVLDHFIITETGYFSFESEGIMTKLKSDPTYMIVKSEWANNNRIKMEMASDKGKKELAKDIAKKMLLKGDSIELIREYTGLSVREINKLLKEVNL